VGVEGIPTYLVNDREISCGIELETDAVVSGARAGFSDGKQPVCGMGVNLVVHLGR
jgi:hypothetical protein